MKYLITGINGQLGHDLYKILNDGKNEVFAPTSLTLNLTDPVTIYKSVLEFHPDVIIHGAAYTAVDKAEEEKEYAELVNAVGTSRLVDAAKMVNAKIIYVSTDYVFDGTKKAPYKVYDDVNPLNWYGKTKRLGEEAVLDYEKGMVVRTQWVFGINGKNFAKTMLKLARTKDEVNVVADQYGAPTYTVDLAEKLVMLSKLNENGIYHASNSGDMSWAGFAKMIFAMNDIKTKVNPIPTSEYKTTAVRPLDTRLDKSRLANDVGDMPSSMDAFARYIDELANDEEMSLVLKEAKNRWKK